MLPERAKRPLWQHRAVTIKKAGKQVWKGYQSDLMKAALWAKEEVRDDGFFDDNFIPCVIAYLLFRPECCFH